MSRTDHNDRNNHDSPGDHDDLRTERLLLRRWRPEDRAPFAAMNDDPAVMEHFPSRLTPAESDAMVDRIETGFAAHGFGLWALEVTEPGDLTGEFIGFTGLNVPGFEAHFTPAVEVGWRLARRAWGHGYASEAARRALAVGFNDYHLREVVSFTSTTNLRSQAVMRRIGMTRDPDGDFDHGMIPPGHPLQRHVLYRIKAPTGPPPAGPPPVGPAPG